VRYGKRGCGTGQETFRSTQADLLNLGFGGTSKLVRREMVGRGRRRG